MQRKYGEFSQIFVWLVINRHMTICDHSTLSRTRNGDSPVSAYPPGHFLQGLKLLVIQQVELGDKVIEVLVAGVDVGLSPDGHEPVKVVDVDMHEHSVEPRQNLLANGAEILGERDVSGDWEDWLVVYLWRTY